MSERDGIEAGLNVCPICGDVPMRNGRGRVGGVICTGIGAHPDLAHLVQTYGKDQAQADAAWNTRALPPAEAEEPSAEMVEGPQPLPSPGLSCLGCKHLATKDWYEPSGDGETFDHGTSARCTAKPTEYGGESISAYWSPRYRVPSWCPVLALRAARPAGGREGGA